MIASKDVWSKMKLCKLHWYELGDTGNERNYQKFCTAKNLNFSFNSNGCHFMKKWGIECCVAQNFGSTKLDYVPGCLVSTLSDQERGGFVKFIDNSWRIVQNAVDVKLLYGSSNSQLNTVLLSRDGEKMGLGKRTGNKKRTIKNGARVIKISANVLEIWNMQKLQKTFFIKKVFEPKSKLFFGPWKEFVSYRMLKVIKIDKAIDHIKF